MERPLRLAPRAFLLARGTRLAADITGCPVLARGLKSAFEKLILGLDPYDIEPAPASA